MPIEMLVPDYYPEFFCIGGACSFTCCGGWDIDLTRSEYNQLRAARVSKELKALLRDGVRRIKGSESDSLYARFALKNGHCALLDKSGLCTLHKECGPEALSYVCSNFPRHVTEAPDMWIAGCSTGCPAVMQKFVGRQAPLTFLVQEKKAMGRATLHLSNAAKRPLVTRHIDIMERCIDIVQNRRYPLRGRMLLLGIALRGLAEQEETGAINVDAWLGQYAPFATEGGMSVHAFSTENRKEALLFHRGVANILFGANHSGIEILAEGVNELFGDFDAEMEFGSEKISQEVWEIYEERRAALDEAFQFDIILEHILANAVISFATPFRLKTIWDDYFCLCVLYGMSRFFAVCCVKGSQEASMVDVLTAASRKVLHAGKLWEIIGERLKVNDFSSLPKATILCNC